MKLQRSLIILFLFIFSSVKVHAAETIALPENALPYQEILKFRDLPKCEVMALSAVVNTINGPPVLVWENITQLMLNIPLPSVGQYEIQVHHLAGGRYPSLKFSAYGKELAASQNGKQQPHVQITRLTTGLIPGQTLPLQVTTQGADGPIGIFAIDLRITDYSPIPADKWQVAHSEDTAQHITEQYQLDQKNILTLPAFCRPASSSQSTRIFSEPSKTLLAVTYFYHDQAFTGYSFKLHTNAIASLWINGERVIDLNSTTREMTGEIPWNKLQRGVNQISVVLSEIPDSNTRSWFELSVSDPENTWIFPKIPSSIDPTRVNHDWPKITLSRGEVHAQLPVPDKDNGFYRAGRFEWAGQITHLSVGNNTIFVPFHSDHLPLGLDHAAGPAEEFFEPVGYDESKPGEAFIKLGVGLFKKPVESKYFFGTSYQPVKFLDWQTDASQDRVRFEQVLTDYHGYAYRYVKELILTNNPNGLVINHHLTNTGQKRIVSNHYSHNFIRLNDTDIDQRYRIDFNFLPRTVNNVRSRLSVKGKQAIPLGKGTIFTPMYGYTRLEDSQVILTLIPENLGLTITLDQPMSRFWLFASDRTICPEMFTHIDLLPGQSKQWVRRYEVTNSD